MKQKAAAHDAIPAMKGRYLHILPHRSADATSNNHSQWHEALEIKLFYSGGTTLAIGDELFLSQPGDIFVINSCTPHSTWDENPGNDYHMLDIDLTKLPVPPDSRCAAVVEAICAGELTFRTYIHGDAPLAGQIERLVAAYEDGDSRGFRVLAETYLLLDMLIERASDRAETGKNRRNLVDLSRKLSPALQMIQQRYAEPLTLEEMASACGLNPRYFCRLFQMRTGVTALTYIHRLRVGHACILLKSTDLSVLEIANRCGFQDREYFTRVFRAQKGCSPMQYRRATHVEPSRESVQFGGMPCILSDLA